MKLIRIEENYQGAIEFCQRHESTCYLCRKEIERLKRILSRHPGHREELNEAIKAIKKGRYYKYHPRRLNLYKSHYDTCADCRMEYDEAISAWEALSTEQKHEEEKRIQEMLVVDKAVD